jgi:fumarate hydratase subunit alpha
MSVIGVLFCDVVADREMPARQRLCAAIIESRFLNRRIFVAEGVVTAREICCREIMDVVNRLCIRANHHLRTDVIAGLRRAVEEEESPVGRRVLEQLLRNSQVAGEEEIPLCQDTGLTVVFVELRQEVRLVGGSLTDAIRKGARRGYGEGYLRDSALEHPFSDSINAGGNTPAVIHTEVIPGDRLRIAVVPKGGGSENTSALGMLKPSDGREGVVRLAMETVDRAGANPCPPTILGVGVSGSAEKAMLLAKHSLLRIVGQPSAYPEIAALERDILTRLNKLGIGPQGPGGRVTCLAAHVETYPCHMASLPVAVNIQCHSACHKEATL